MLRHDPTHDILVNLDTEGMRDLLGDLSATKARIAPFHFNDGGNQFLRRSFGTGRTAIDICSTPVLGGTG